MNVSHSATLPSAIAAAVNLHLMGLPAGSEVATAVLAEAVGQPVDVIPLAMTHHRLLGLVRARRRPGSRLTWWSVGDGTIEEEREADHISTHAAGDAQRLVEQAISVPNSVFPGFDAATVLASLAAAAELLGGPSIEQFEFESLTQFLERCTKENP